MMNKTFFQDLFGMFSKHLIATEFCIGKLKKHRAGKHTSKVEILFG
jgi:hypothetical protein